MPFFLYGFCLTSFGIEQFVSLFKETRKAPAWGANGSRPGKPCYVSDGNLSQVSLAPSASIRFGTLPLPNLGFSLAGLASLHLGVAAKLVSVVPWGVLPARGVAPPSCATMPGVIASPGANVTAIAGRASMDFPLPCGSNRLGRRGLFYLICWGLTPRE